MTLSPSQRQEANDSFENWWRISDNDGLRVKDKEAVREYWTRSWELATEAANRVIDGVWAKCHIVYYHPTNVLDYPLEHSMKANKNMRAMIEHAIAKEPQASDEGDQL